MDASPAIQFENVSLTLGNRSFFNQFSLTVNAGEKFLIFGPYGSGKSLIARLIMRVTEPDSGIIRVQGKDIAALSENRLNHLRNSIGFVPKENHLINNLTVYQNIALPLTFHAHLKSSELHRKVSAVIDFLNLGKVANLRPALIQTLSAKKVAIGRAMVNLPEIMIVDSPYVNLDTIAACEINRLIFQSASEWIKEQRLYLSLPPSITFLISVNMLLNILDFVDRTAMLYKGEVVFEGAPASLFESENPYVQQYMQAQSEGPIKYEEA